MAERKARKKARPTSPAKQPPEEAQWVNVSSQEVVLWLLNACHSNPGHTTPPSDQPQGILYFAGHGATGENATMAFISGTFDAEEFKLRVGKGIGPAAPDEPEIEWLLSEIDRSIERMRRDQEEIDQLKEETRAAIARLKAA